MDKMCKEASELILLELLKDKNKEMFNKQVLDPCVSYIGSRLWPYIISIIGYLLILLFLLIYILFLTKKINS